MKIELELDSSKLATDVVIELIIEEVLNRLDVKWANLVSEKMEDIEELLEDMQSRVELDMLLSDVDDTLVDDTLVDDMMEDVTVVTSNGTAVPDVKTCSRLDAVLDTKLEALYERVVAAVMRRMVKIYGSPQVENVH